MRHCLCPTNNPALGCLWDTSNGRRIAAAELLPKYLAYMTNTPSYLLEETPEAQEMRQNVLNLLHTEEENNLHLATQLIEGGGMHPDFEVYFQKKFSHIHHLTTLEKLPALVLPYVKSAHAWEHYGGNELPEVLRSCTNLETLNINSSIIKNLPEWIGEWQYLKDFTFRHGKITELPETVGNWKNLTICNLANNEIKKIPDVVGNWANLQGFDISHNHLHELPDSVGKWQNLTFFRCANNRITTLPMGTENWKHLRKLNIASNLFVTLPAWAGEWRNIVSFRCDVNKITVLPEAMRQWAALEELYYTNNACEELPEWIGDWENIRSIMLQNNQLTTLPASMRKWKKIEKFDLRYNRFGDSIEHLHNLAGYNVTRASNLQLWQSLFEK
jgi:Leucine-rich repeat (LRR) protein